VQPIIKIKINYLSNIFPKIRFSALDSKKIKLGDYFDIKRDILSVNFRVTKNEYACLLSHLETIRTFAESEYSTALILEDDVIFNKHTDTFQDVIDNAPKDWDIIRLSYNCFTKKPVTKKYDPFKVICNSTNCVVNWGAQAYLIHKKAAKQIIAELYDEKYKLENDMFHVADYLLFHKLKTYTYNKKRILVILNFVKIQGFNVRGVKMILDEKIETGFKGFLVSQ